VEKKVGFEKCKESNSKVWRENKHKSKKVREVGFSKRTRFYERKLLRKYMAKILYE